jgi:hypothetical protein
MDKRKFPADIDEVVATAVNRVESQLEETEYFINTKKIKLFEETIGVAQDNYAKVDGFNRDSCFKLKQLSDDNLKLVDKFQKAQQLTNKTFTKTQGLLDKDRALSKFGKQCIADLKEDVSSIFFIVAIY